MYKNLQNSLNFSVSILIKVLVSMCKKFKLINLFKCLVQETNNHFGHILIIFCSFRALCSMCLTFFNMCFKTVLLGLNKSGSSIKFSGNLFLFDNFWLYFNLQTVSLGEYNHSGKNIFSSFKTQMKCFWYFENCNQVFRVKYNS